MVPQVNLFYVLGIDILACLLTFHIRIWCVVLLTRLFDCLLALLAWLNVCKLVSVYLFVRSFAVVFAVGCLNPHNAHYW